MSGLTEELKAGAQALGVALPPEQEASLLAFVELLGKWNKVYNLTAVRTPREMLVQHLLDSLSVIRPLRQHAAGRALRLLDVGSGGGLPGIVIAICCPDWQVDCVDAVGKKAAFIQQVAGQLHLANLRGVHGRVETMKGSYDVVCSRAFASLPDFVVWSESALAEQGVWMAMKGKHPEQELAALPASTTVFHVEQVQVPGLDAERCIVWMRRAGAPGATARAGA